MAIMCPLTLKLRHSAVCNHDPKTYRFFPFFQHQMILPFYPLSLPGFTCVNQTNQLLLCAAGMETGSLRRSRWHKIIMTEKDTAQSSLFNCDL